MSVLESSLEAAGSAAWGWGSAGGDYCFPADENGNVLPKVEAIPDNYCGVSYAFGLATDGYRYCFPAKADGTVLRGRTPENIHRCAHGYKWSPSTQGTNCFPMDASGNVPNRIEPVEARYCL